MTTIPRGIETLTEDNVPREVEYHERAAVESSIRTLEQERRRHMDYEDYTLADDIDELIAKLEDHLRLLVEWDANSSVIDANTGELVALDVPKEDLHNLGAETIEQTRG